MKLRELRDAIFDNGVDEDFQQRETNLLARESLPRRIAYRILMDVTDRRGWRQAWDQFEDDIREEIFDEWTKIIGREIDGKR